jgi:novobiocin biosynthesis protein NovU/D-mycarose 3-C-methyltransferase
LDFGALPLAGGFLAGPEAAAVEQKYPLAIHVCNRCGLVQVLDPVSPDILFQDYSFSSSTIKPLVDHFCSYAKWMTERLQPRLVVEFGSNDGVLLAPLQALGVRAVGVDVSRNITDIARAKGLQVLTGFFDAEMAGRLRDEYGLADVVTGSNAFAHNDAPERLLEAANIVLQETGYLCLEFMYAGDLLEQLQWDTLYHEHLTFYSLATIGALLERHGFYVVDAERLPMHGGSLRVTAARTGAPKTAGVEAILRYEQETGLNEPESWRKFGVQSRRKIEIVKHVFSELARRRSIWAYGAAGKATMWVNAADMHYLGAVVDASPLRAGKLMPGTHTPIVFPEEFRRNPPDHVFVTAWNYADLIRSKETWFPGVWSTPLPDLRFF